MNNAGIISNETHNTLIHDIYGILFTVYIHKTIYEWNQLIIKEINLRISSYITFNYLKIWIKLHAVIYYQVHNITPSKDWGF